MRHLIKKILSASLSFGFISWFGLFSVFPAPLAFAAPACDDFSSSSYVITNGGPDFLVGDTIKTKISLKAKSAVVGDSDYIQVYLVMDISNSMKGTDTSSSNTKISEAKEALTAVVDSMQTADNGKLKSQVGLIAFSGTVYFKKSLTSDFNAVKTAISALKADDPGTGTSIYGGLKAAGDKFNSLSLPSNTQRFIVLASDGEQTTDVPPSPSKSSAINSVPSDVTVHTVGMGADYKASWETLMKEIASNAGTGKGTYELSSVANLISTFQSIITGILGSVSLKNVSLLFTRDDTAATTLVSTSPGYTSYTTPKISWVKNLGTVSSGGTKDVYVNYTGAAVGTNVPLNLPSIKVSYDSTAGTCTDIPLTLPVRTVNITSSFSCTGTTPANAAIYPDDTTGLTADTSKTYSASDTAPQCQYGCNSGFTWNGTACLASVDGICGPADGSRSFTAPSLADLCDPTTPTANPSPAAYDSATRTWEWVCMGENGGNPSPMCTASKRSFNFINF